MLRRVPCLAFLNGAGKLNGPCAVVAMEGGDRMGRAALRNDIPRAAFAAPALRAHTQFELHFVEGHACTNMARNLAVGHSAANANDHGSEGALAGWLKMANYKYEFVAFAIAIGKPLRLPRLPVSKTKKSGARPRFASCAVRAGPLDRYSISPICDCR